MIIDPADLDPTSSYKLLIGSVLPRAIAWVSTSSTAGVGNIAPVSFFTVVGRFPPVLSITLQPRSDGVTLKDTFVNIRDTNEFVVNIASIGQADAVHRSAYEFDTDVDEFEALGLEKAAIARRFRHRASPTRRSPSNASSTASSRCRRCPTTSCGDGSSASTSATTSTCPTGASTSARWECSAGSRPSTPWSTTSSPRRCPKSSSKNSAAQRAEPARRARHRLLAHRHGRMVTVGLDEGGEMTVTNEFASPHPATRPAPTVC